MTTHLREQTRKILKFLDYDKQKSWKNTKKKRLYGVKTRKKLKIPTGYGVGGFTSKRRT